jgi:phosphate starvation-inducible PhoH-like protein
LNTDQSAPEATPPGLASHTFSLEPNDARNLATLCGQLDAHLRQIEKRLDITIHNRSNQFELRGHQSHCEMAATLLSSLYQDITHGAQLSPETIHLRLQEADLEMLSSARDIDTSADGVGLIRTKRISVRPRGQNQRQYVASINDHDINFGIGPAGTGKTYLAVACAVRALLNEQVKRILLVRPAVEAGERLGFLPGDLSQKVDPYLRPLYDALYEMLGFETVNKYIERHIIEVAPLAFMRGRTLNHAFIILDEAQNTTREQMKMFLTRIGFGSTAVVTGDTSQIDLPRGTQSGLTHAMTVLEDVAGITFTEFGNKDVVRHPLVQRVVSAYDAHEQSAASTRREDPP